MKNFSSYYQNAYGHQIFNVSETERSEQYFYISKEQTCSK